MWNWLNEQAFEYVVSGVAFFAFWTLGAYAVHYATLWVEKLPDGRLKAVLLRRHGVPTEPAVQPEPRYDPGLAQAQLEALAQSWDFSKRR